MLEFQEGFSDRLLGVVDAIENTLRQSGLSPQDQITLLFYEAIISIYNLNMPAEDQVRLLYMIVNHARSHLEDMHNRPPNWEDDTITH